MKSAGKPLRVSSLNTASVRAFLKLLITKTLYHSLIQWSIVLYQTMIHLFALEEKQAEAFRQALASASRNCADRAFTYRSARGDLREFSPFKLHTLPPWFPRSPNPAPPIAPAPA